MRFLRLRRCRSRRAIPLRTSKTGDAISATAPPLFQPAAKPEGGGKPVLAEAAGVPRRQGRLGSPCRTTSPSAGSADRPLAAAFGRWRHGLHSLPRLPPSGLEPGPGECPLPTVCNHGHAPAARATGLCAGRRHGAACLCRSRAPGGATRRNARRRGDRGRAAAGARQDSRGRGRDRGHPCPWAFRGSSAGRRIASR